jgi:hypothetical protein
MRKMSAAPIRGQSLPSIVKRNDSCGVFGNLPQKNDQTNPAAAIFPVQPSQPQKQNPSGRQISAQRCTKGRSFPDISAAQRPNTGGRFRIRAVSKPRKLHPAANRDVQAFSSGQTAPRNALKPDLNLHNKYGSGAKFARLRPLED